MHGHTKIKIVNDASTLLFVYVFLVERSSDVSLGELSKRVLGLSVTTLISCRALTCRWLIVADLLLR